MQIRRQLLGFSGWFLVTFLAAALGARASISASSFYADLVLPTWAPPASLFGPVWTALYALMALAAFLVWRERGWRAAASALTLYLLQLGLNTLWSWLFFAWKQGGLAFADILLLLVLIVATLVAFWRIHKVAACMLLPYLAWVGFASVLNYAVWQANPGLL